MVAQKRDGPSEEVIAENEAYFKVLDKRFCKKDVETYTSGMIVLF